VELRLARLLLRLCRDFSGNLTIPLFKREDMGLMIDAKFETVSRALSSLAESGLLSEVTRFNVKVNDVAALRQYCSLGAL
jgi:CRP-like cAMP-binding protein